MKFKADEIVSVIQQEIEHYESQIDVREVGRVLEVGDGIARVYGLSGVMAGEMVEFPGGTIGLAFNLEEHSVGVIILGDYLSIQELRSDLRRILGEFCDQRPTESANRAFEPFYFCESVEVVLPLPWDARTLAGFRAGLERLSHAAFYHHFIASRLRLQLRTNDFSHWFRSELSLGDLAARTDRIDVYTNTLDTARRELVELVDREMDS